MAPKLYDTFGHLSSPGELSVQEQVEGVDFLAEHLVASRVRTLASFDTFKLKPTTPEGTSESNNGTIKEAEIYAVLRTSQPSRTI
jgi:hypothetical protein